MKFKQRLKQDKKFRMGMVLLGILLFSMYNSAMPEKKERASQATCDIHDEWGKSDDNKEECYEAGCVPLSTAGFKLACEPCGEVGEIVYAPSDCCNYYAEEQELAFISNLFQSLGDAISGLLGGEQSVPTYKCKYLATSEQINEREADIASLLDGALPDMKPKTKYYMVLFGGGMLVMMMIGTVL